jgi:hypothetical protein
MRVVDRSVTPWLERASTPTIVNQPRERLAVKFGAKAVKPHGLTAWTRIVRVVKDPNHLTRSSDGRSGAGKLDLKIDESSRG